MNLLEPETAPLQQRVLSSDRNPNRQSSDIGVDPALVSAFGLLEDEIHRKNQGYPEAGAGILTAIFIRIWRLAAGQIKILPGNRDELLLCRIEDFIRSGLSGHIDAEILCREFAIGRTALFELFRNGRQLSPAAPDCAGHSVRFSMRRGHGGMPSMPPNRYTADI